MKIELFNHLTKGYPAIKMPGLLLSIYRTRRGDKPFIKLGRLYAGYVGLYWITRVFTVNLWIYNQEREP